MTYLFAARQEEPDRVLTVLRRRAKPGYPVEHNGGQGRVTRELFRTWLGGWYRRVAAADVIDTHQLV